MSKLAAYFILMAYLAAFPNVAQADDEGIVTIFVNRSAFLGDKAFKLTANITVVLISDHQLTCYVCTSKTISIPPYNTITASQKCEGQQDTEFLQRKHQEYF